MFNLLDHQLVRLSSRACPLGKLILPFQLSALRLLLHTFLKGGNQAEILCQQGGSKRKRSYRLDQKRTNKFQRIEEPACVSK